MEKKDIYELTNPQKSIWNTELFFSNTTVNNICVSGIINEEVNIEILKKAINLLVKENDSFRTKLIVNDSVPVQFFSEYIPFNIDVIKVENKKEFNKIEQQMVEEKFNLINSELYKFEIIKFPDNTAGIILNVHHMIADSWSLGITIQEIVRIYKLLINDNNVEFKTNSYIDYINSEKNYKLSKRYEDDRKYWEEAFDIIPEQATIPAVKQNLKNVSNKSNRKSFNINQELSLEINDFCKNNDVTKFNFFMAVYALYIGRVSKLEDFVIGTPILNRTNIKEKYTMGMFVNTIPVKVDLKKNIEFKEFVFKLNLNMFNVLRHQKYSYTTILEDLRKKRGNIPNLYNIIISYQITKAINDEYGSYTTNWMFNNYCANDFNIHISDVNNTGGLVIDYDYLIDKYNENEIDNIHKRILNIIKQVLLNSSVKINDIDIVTKEEKDKILNEFNNAKVKFPREKTMVSLFEEQVEKTPENIAVVFDNQKLTYRELNEKANSLANYFISIGIKPGTVIGLRLNKRLEMIIGILAIIKSGCCYLPINMQYPEDRVKFMIEDSNCKLLIGTEESLKDVNIEVDKIDIDLKNKNIYLNSIENLKIDITPEDLIYIIYTSGSTGTPKGAMLCHRNLVRLFRNDNFLFEFGENDTWTMFHSVAFDFSVWEMYGALLFGGKLVLVKDEIAQDPNLFLDLMRKENVTVLNQTPTYFYKLLKSEKDRNDRKLNVRYIIFGGEALKPNLIKDWHNIYPNTKLINMYGITETTVHVTYKELSEKDLNSSISNIGVPIPTLHVIIVDKNMNLLPFGVEGEMCVIGEGVFKGYLNREDLNKTKLVTNHKYSNKIIYRSGDTAIMHEDGNLEYIGRIDTQVKIRGFRVELGEIEEKILKYANIETCIVTKKVDDNNREMLCAYYIKNGPISISNLRIVLNEHLPSYMIPQYFIEIDKVPININGKTDLKALPMPIRAQTGTTMVKPRNDIDKKLIKIYKEVLHVNDISILDSFLELGGDSLTAINVCENVNKNLNTNLNVKDILDKNTIMNLSDYILNKINTNKKQVKILTSAEKDFYSLSTAQKRIYYASKMIGEDNIVYNVPGAILVNEILNKEKVEECFRKIIEKQSVFRTSFVIDNGEVKQKIQNKVKFNVRTFENENSELENIINNFPKPFNLETAPLLRVELHYLDNEKTLLLLDSHHIIMDGCSLEILINDFCKVYNEEEINKLDIEYKDFAEWEQNYVSSESIKESEEYWINKFNDSDIPSVNLPYDYKMPSLRSYKGNTITKKINKKDFNKYLAYAKELGVSPYMFFLSAFFILLYKYTGQEELILGTPTAGRDKYQLKNIIGMFVNNLVVDAKINSSDSFVEFLQKIKKQVMEDLIHQDYPYDLLVKKLNITTDNSRNPLFDIMFIYQNTGDKKIKINGEEAEIIVSKSNISKFDLSVEIDPDKYIINLEYRVDLFKESTIERLFKNYINTLNNVIENKDSSIKDIEIISNEERNLIINKFNDTKTEYPRNKTIIELFEEQVQQNPDNIAVVFEDKKLTYRELNEKANQLANFLKKQDVNNEDVIAILLDKSLEMIIAIIAILKNGCAYLPIDIGYPKERIEYILKDSKARLLFTSRELNLEKDLLIKSFYIDIDNDNIYGVNEKDNLNYFGKNTDLAYIMYTSGSTGKPKGVMVENKSVVRLVKDTNYIKFNSDDKILQTGSIVFDACTFEIWGALLNGLELYVIKKEELLDASLLHTYILKNGITVLWLTAPLFNQLCEENPHMFRTVRCVLSGGDVLSCKHINLVKTANPNITIINGYGPTENTTFSCCHIINKKYRTSVPIGKPIANSTGYIVSKDGNLQPIGVAGELWVGGDGVARGYLNKPELTAEKFIDNPFQQGKIYKTGDLTKWNEDGTIEFLGRIDSQIKIRGFRVELSEITTIVSQYQEVKEAYTIFKDVKGEKAICTYIVGKKSIDIDELTRFLADFLPQYMIPKYIMQVKKLPKNQNGKIDKNSLPEIEVREKKSRKILLPTNEMEEKLSNIFKVILGVEEISIDDNFFECGGDSISAMKLQIEALKQDINITYGDIFKYPTIKELAQSLNNKLKIENNNTVNEKDLYKYDNIIKTNNVKELENSDIANTPIGNVLLTGVTGFLGAHILDSYLKNETGTIYCLIRSKNYRTPLERLKNTLNFYFKDKYDEYIGTRIICVEGDITQNNLSLTKSEYEKLGNSINTVIHSAALVKHFGNYREFEEINIKGTKNVIKLCEEFKLKLMHISTISVSGNNFAEGSYIENNIKEEIMYGEDRFYIGQNVENLYVKSKFLAEKEVLDAISNGVQAYILRMGNLTSRFSEGKFQQNHLENAFVNRVKTFLQLGCAPEYMIDGYAEFTPIDYCGEAIIKIANHYDSRFSIFHLLNHKHLLLTKFYEILQQLGIDFKIVSSEEFSKLIDEMLKNNEKASILQGIIRDFNEDKELVYKSNIKIKSEFTKKFLELLDFEWPEIDKKYIERYLTYLIDIGYLNIKLKED